MSLDKERFVGRIVERIGNVGHRGNDNDTKSIFEQSSRKTLRLSFTFTSEYFLLWVLVQVSFATDIE